MRLIRSQVRASSAKLHWAAWNEKSSVRRSEFLRAEARQSDENNEAKWFRVCRTERGETHGSRKRSGVTDDSNCERAGIFVSWERDFVWSVWRAGTGGICRIHAYFADDRVSGRAGAVLRRAGNVDRDFCADWRGVHRDCDGG